MRCLHVDKPPASDSIPLILKMCLWAPILCRFLYFSETFCLSDSLKTRRDLLNVMLLKTQTTTVQFLSYLLFQNRHLRRITMNYWATVDMNPDCAVQLLTSYPSWHTFSRLDSITAEKHIDNFKAFAWVRQWKSSGETAHTWTFPGSSRYPRKRIISVRVDRHLSHSFLVNTGIFQRLVMTPTLFCYWLAACYPIPQTQTILLLVSPP